MNNIAKGHVELVDALYQTLEPGKRPIKVAKLVVDAFGLEIDEQTERRIRNALEELETRHDIVVDGLLSDWRASEILRKP